MDWTLQISVALPDGATPEDVPALARLEAFIREHVAESETVRIDRFVVQPGAVGSYLVATIDMHRLQEDDSCFCGWLPDGGSHAEHVAAVFEESTRAHAFT